MDIQRRENIQLKIFTRDLKNTLLEEGVILHIQFGEKI